METVKFKAPQMEEMTLKFKEQQTAIVISKFKGQQTRTQIFKFKVPQMEEVIVTFRVAIMRTKLKLKNLSQLIGLFIEKVVELCSTKTQVVRMLASY